MGKWRRLHGVEATISLFRHLWDAVSPRSPWWGAIVSTLGVLLAIVRDLPLWILVAVSLGLVLSILGIIDAISRRRHSTAGSVAEAVISAKNPGSPQYVDATVGTRCRIIHDMTIHNKQCVIGNEEYCFHTIWSRGGKSSVHAYSTGPSMAGVATKEGVMSVTQVHDPEAWKYGADSVLVEKGQVVTFKNAAGNYLPVRIDRIPLCQRT